MSAFIFNLPNLSKWASPSRTAADGDPDIVTDKGGTGTDGGDPSGSPGIHTRILVRPQVSKASDGTIVYGSVCNYSRVPVFSWNWTDQRSKAAVEALETNLEYFQGTVAGIRAKQTEKSRYTEPPTSQLEVPSSENEIEEWAITLAKHVGWLRGREPFEGVTMHVGLPRHDYTRYIPNLSSYKFVSPCDADTRRGTENWGGLRETLWPDGRVVVDHGLDSLV
jgi:hypothetical protein